MKLRKGVCGLLVLSWLMPMVSEKVGARQPVMKLVTSNLKSPKVWGGVTLPGGTEVSENEWGIHRALLRENVTHCGIKFAPGTRFWFGGGGIGVILYSAELSVANKAKGIELPATTEVRFADNDCVIDSVIAHDSEIDFGPIQLGGWIYLHPNGKLKQAFADTAKTFNGVLVQGELHFSESGGLRQFYSGGTQKIHGIPIQKDVCIELTEDGSPSNFVLESAYKLNDHQYERNDRVLINADGKATLLYRPKSVGQRPMTNC